MLLLRNLYKHPCRTKSSVLVHDQRIANSGTGTETTQVQVKLVRLNKNFGFSKDFHLKYELGKEIGWGTFAHTCRAKAKMGEMKGGEVAVKIILKAKMTTEIAIEDVRREVIILSTLTGHRNLAQFYEAFEDENHVYIVMELCEGGELWDGMLSRTQRGGQYGQYSEEDAKLLMIQILDVVSFCHIHGVVHRDLKPENFLFKTREGVGMKLIDFGLSEFVNPDERLKDIAGTAYYMAPEVLRRTYGTKADMWSIGVIAYMLLCGHYPFWAPTDPEVFRAVLDTQPNFDGAPWPSLSIQARGFVKMLLNKDHRKRPTAAQALCHPWIRDTEGVEIPLDLMLYNLIRDNLSSSLLRKSALRALAKTLKPSQLLYLDEQFRLLMPSRRGDVSLKNLKTAFIKNSTDTMKDLRVLDFVNKMSSLRCGRINLEEFTAYAIDVSQIMEYQARHAYDIFNQHGNRPIIIGELASLFELSPSVLAHQVPIQDWVRQSDGQLSFAGFTKLLHQ